MAGDCTRLLLIVVFRALCGSGQRAFASIIGELVIFTVSCLREGLLMFGRLPCFFFGAVLLLWNLITLTLDLGFLLHFVDSKT